jgi:hypothetical protein
LDATRFFKSGKEKEQKKRDRHDEGEIKRAEPFSPSPSRLSLGSKVSTHQNPGVARLGANFELK